MKTTLIISYDGENGSGVNIITANSLLEALKKVSEKHGYGIADLDEDGEKEEIPTTASILQKIDDENGDGCDFIISIIQKDNCKIIYKCNS